MAEEKEPKVDPKWQKRIDAVRKIGEEDSKSKSTKKVDE